MSQWFEEYDAESEMGRRYKVSAKLFSETSAFQKIEIFQTATHGRLLAHDDLVMTTEKDEFIYHDMITHVPMMVHPNPRRVLIIGGGDGGTAREVLRHKSVEKCVMVEIDAVVVKAAKLHLPETACELENPKLTLLFEDGIAYIKNCKETFDVIIVDSSDPVGPASPLFNEDFYRQAYRCLADDGIVVSQNESPFYHQKMQRALLEILKGVFPKTHLYCYTNLTYPGAYWSFSFASKKYCPLRDFHPERVRQSGIVFRYYTAGMHYASFQLPAFLEKEYASILTPLPGLTLQNGR